jgi:hypothetical protein
MRRLVVPPSMSLPDDGESGNNDTAATADTSDTDRLTPDRAFDLLADPRRWRALAALRSADGPMALVDLAAATAARVEGVDPAAVSLDRRERTAAQLHHVHLPKLDDADVVSYDPAENRATLTDRAERLDPCFEAIATFSDPADERPDADRRPD